MNTKTIKRLAFAAGVALLSSSASQAAVSWHWQAVPSNNSIKNTITNSMNAGVWSYNRKSAEYSRNIPVRYTSSVPTANASYLGRIQFGGSRGSSTAHHEISHIFGTGTYSGWSGKLGSGNTWKGWRANRQHTTYDGRNVSTDRSHFWNYNMNRGWEDRTRHVVMQKALRDDMSL